MLIWLIPIMVACLDTDDSIYPVRLIMSLPGVWIARIFFLNDCDRNDFLGRLEKNLSLTGCRCCWRISSSVTPQQRDGSLIWIPLSGIQIKNSVPLCALWETKNPMHSYRQALLVRFWLRTLYPTAIRWYASHNVLPWPAFPLTFISAFIDSNILTEF